MNILLLGLVLYSYFVPSAPKFFKENKQLVLGMFIGVTIYQMNLVEGMENVLSFLPGIPKNTCSNDSDCMNEDWRKNEIRGSDGKCCNTKVKCGDGDHSRFLGGVKCYTDDAEDCSLAYPNKGTKDRNCRITT